MPTPEHPDIPPSESPIANHAPTLLQVARVYQKLLAATLAYSDTYAAIIEAAVTIDLQPGVIAYGIYGPDGRYIPPAALPNIPDLEAHLAAAKLELAELGPKCGVCANRMIQDPGIGWQCPQCRYKDALAAALRSRRDLMRAEATIAALEARIAELTPPPTKEN